MSPSSRATRRGRAARAGSAAPRPAWSLRHRLARLAVGQLLFGVALAMVLRADLGASPWDVLHQGLALRTGWSFGLVLLVAGAVVLLCWVPLRVRPGVGTVANVVLVAAAVELGLRLLPAATSAPAAAGLLIGGVALNALGTALYVGARLGPGPRDGLMTGLVARTGRPVALVRGAIEGSVVLVGWLLGGTLGVGTLVFALAIGPLVGLLLPRLAMPVPERAAPDPGRGSGARPGPPVSDRRRPRRGRPRPRAAA
ncbi:hypothetical protein WDZ17_13325 [Pseudokineococcus basanitobsidens]|uniref:Membrane protein YczE n=1 Tax=Pseudokineococcus basanitobsidens TaxID=1926649 RepID=A0ABU8RMI9_9ACTN